jgi:hypothetical protein
VVVTFIFLGCIIRSPRKGPSHIHQLDLISISPGHLLRADLWASRSPLNLSTSSHIAGAVDTDTVCAYAALEAPDGQLGIMHFSCARVSMGQPQTCMFSWVS